VRDGRQEGVLGAGHILLAKIDCSQIIERGVEVRRDLKRSLVVLQGRLKISVLLLFIALFEFAHGPVIKFPRRAIGVELMAASAAHDGMDGGAHLLAYALERHENLCPGADPLVNPNDLAHGPITGGLHDDVIDAGGEGVEAKVAIRVGKGFSGGHIPLREQPDEKMIGPIV